MCLCLLVDHPDGLRHGSPPTPRLHIVPTSAAVSYICGRLPKIVLSCMLQVIASNDINDEMNQLDVPVFWPERRYPWGTAQAFNPDHSDLFFLRCVPHAVATRDVAACGCKGYTHIYGVLYWWEVQEGSGHSGPSCSHAMQDEAWSMLTCGMRAAGGLHHDARTRRHTCHVAVSMCCAVWRCRALLLKEALEDICKDKRAR